MRYQKKSYLMFSVHGNSEIVLPSCEQPLAHHNLFEKFSLKLVNILTVDSRRRKNHFAEDNISSDIN